MEINTVLKFVTLLCLSYERQSGVLTAPSGTSSSLVEQSNFMMKMGLSLGKLETSQSFLEHTIRKLSDEVADLKKHTTELETKRESDDSLLFIDGIPDLSGKVNHALGKTAIQSSTHGGAAAQRALDGNRNPSWDGNSCSHTVSGRARPWWMVDFGYVTQVGYVLIQNRGDCCGSYLQNFQVLVGSDLASMDICTSFIGTARDGQLLELACDRPQRGKYLKIQALGVTHLMLCEVEVYSPVGHSVHRQSNHTFTKM